MIVVIKKGVRHTKGTNILFVRITDDGLSKLKKRRLPHGRKSQLELIAPDVKSFIEGGSVNQVPGLIQLKSIDTLDQKMEIIPQNYLDNSALDVKALQESLGSVYSELVFQRIRRGMM